MSGRRRDPGGDDRWSLVIGLVPAVLVVVPRLMAAASAARMPDPIAVHWSLGGAPNGTMSLAASEALSTAMALLFWAVGAVMVRNARSWRVRRTVATYTAATLGFLGILEMLVLWANLDQPTWQDATLPGWVVLLGLGGAAVVGWGTWALCGRPPEVDTPVGGLALTDSPPTAGLPPDAVGARWEGSSGNAWLAALGSTIGAACLVAAAVVSWWLVLPGLVVLVACATVATVHVRCDATGLVVRYGLLGWPVQRIPMAQIVVAHAIDLEPVDWGGWGYRWAPGQNATAAVTRRGPAIVVERTDGRRFAVTVDDATTGAGTLNDLRTGPGSG